jgi:hypothetical protein
MRVLVYYVRHDKTFRPAFHNIRSAMRGPTAENARYPVGGQRKNR